MTLKSRVRRRISESTVRKHANGADRISSGRRPGNLTESAFSALPARKSTETEKFGGADLLKILKIVTFYPSFSIKVLFRKLLDG